MMGTDSCFERFPSHPDDGRYHGDPIANSLNYYS